MKKLVAVLSLMLFASLFCQAQLTVLNVPSADVQDKGTTYFRLDSGYNPVHGSFTFTPNFMYGVGHNADIGFNVESFSIKGGNQASLVPNFKWKVLATKGEGIDVYVGDKLVVPVSRRSYDAGNFFYGVATLKAEGLGRLGAGVYNSQNYVGSGNRTGMLLTLEHWFTDKYVGAADWQSGANGMTTLGVMYYPTKRVMIIPAYMLGNTGIREGNHGAVLYVGYSLSPVK